jgi:hypothetical protein
MARGQVRLLHKFLLHFEDCQLRSSHYFLDEQSLTAHIPKGLGCEQIECVPGSYEACRTEKNFSAKAMLKDLAFNLNRLKNMHFSDEIGDTQYNELKKKLEGVEAEVKDEAQLIARDVNFIPTPACVFH